jgi:hypothetical protein
MTVHFGTPVKMGIVELSYLLNILHETRVTFKLRQLVVNSVRRRAHFNRLLNPCHFESPFIFRSTRSCSSTPEWCRYIARRLAGLRLILPADCFRRGSPRFVAHMSEVLEFHEARQLGRFLQVWTKGGINGGCRNIPDTSSGAIGMLVI